jgi:hypothetical protein
MSDSRPRRFRRISVVSVAALMVTTVLSTAVVASHIFTDVPDSNQFHGSISWMSENEVTRGCNPPDNDEYCPKDNVTREQMASFMRRLAQTYGTVGDQVTDSGNQVTINSASGIEVASIEVTPKAEANVALNAHATIGSSGASVGDFQIHRDSCTGTLIASGTWQTGDVDEAFTFALTGVDVVNSDTTYVLCVDREDGSPDAFASTRALTATWAPTS